MPDKSKSRVQKGGHASHTFFGELDAQPLLAWLNRRNRQSGDPVERLIRLHSNPGEGLAPFERPGKIRALLAKTVRHTKFAVAPVIGEVTTKLWEVAWRPVGRMNYDQGLALHRVLRFANEGLLDRVRQCVNKNCGVWFFSRFKHRRFHTRRCQQQTFQSDPDFRKERRKYMREHYRKQKLRERKAR